ncbi:MAG: hypothetical protein R2817_09475 [Flavobacteriales bacterium]
MSSTNNDLVIKGETGLPGALTTYEGYQSAFLLLIAKPDTHIRVIRERKYFELADLKNLNRMIEDKLKNHNLIVSVLQVNMVFTDSTILEMSSWKAFEQHRWELTPQATQSVAMTWDISIQLPNYQAPQRHTLKVRIGEGISPRDMMHLMFLNDNFSEHMQAGADVVVKVDFINNVLAGELIQQVVNWHSSLAAASKGSMMQIWCTRNMGVIVNANRSLVPISMLFVVVYYMATFSSSFTSAAVTPILIAWVLFAALGVLRLGDVISTWVARLLSRKIDAFEPPARFAITKGDEREVKRVDDSNRDVRNWLVIRFVIYIASLTAAVVMKHVIEGLLD